MSRVPNQETYAELCRLPKPNDLLSQQSLARKMLVALARETGILADQFDNYTGMAAVRDLFADTPGSGTGIVARPTLPPLLRAPLTSAAPVTKDRFKSRTMDETQLPRVVAIRAAFQAVEDVVLHVTAPGRLQSLVLTALEEACMWAVKAVSHENG